MQCFRFRDGSRNCLNRVVFYLPLDDAKDDAVGGRPEPNLIRATIDGNHLSVGADTDAPAYVEVIDTATGVVVAEEEFLDETEVSIPQSGSYVVQIYLGNTVMAGEFEVE